MPVSVVKSARDERLWGDAKSQAAEQGHTGEYDVIMGIYMRMKHRLGGKKPRGKPWRRRRGRSK